MSNMKIILKLIHRLIFGKPVLEHWTDQNENQKPKPDLKDRVNFFYVYLLNN